MNWMEQITITVEHGTIHMHYILTERYKDIVFMPEFYKTHISITIVEVKSHLHSNSASFVFSVT